MKLVFPSTDTPILAPGLGDNDIKFIRLKIDSAGYSDTRANGRG